MLCGSSVHFYFQFNTEKKILTTEDIEEIFTYKQQSTLD